MSTPAATPPAPAPDATATQTPPAPSAEELKRKHDEGVSLAMDKLFNTPRADAATREHRAQQANQTPPAEVPVEGAPAVEGQPPEGGTPGTPTGETQPAQPAPAEPGPEEPEAPRSSAVLPDEEVERIAERVAAKTAPRQPTAPQPPPVDPAAGLNLNAGDLKLLDVLSIVEEMNPAQYHGIRARMISFWHREKAWLEDWQKKNPGKDPDDDDDYLAFCEEHEPKIEDHALDMAKEERLKREWRAEQEKVRARDQEEQQKRERAHAYVPRVQHASALATASMVRNASPEFAALITGEVITPENEKAMKEKDPVQHRILLEHGEEMSLVFQALALAFENVPADRQMPGTVKMKTNGRRIHPLEEAIALVAELETQFSKMPKEETTIEGRVFITQDQMAERLESIEKSDRSAEEKKNATRDLYSRYWTMGLDDYRRGFEAEYARRAKERIAEIEAAADRKAKGPGAPATPAPQPAPTPTPAPATARPANNAPPDTTRRPAPAVVSASDAANPANNRPLTKEQQDKVIDAKMGWS